MLAKLFGFGADLNANVNADAEGRLLADAEARGILKARGNLDVDTENRGKFDGEFRGKFDGEQRFQTEVAGNVFAGGKVELDVGKNLAGIFKDLSSVFVKVTAASSSFAYNCLALAVCIVLVALRDQLPGLLQIVLWNMSYSAAVLGAIVAGLSYKIYEVQEMRKAKTQFEEASRMELKRALSNHKSALEEAQEREDEQLGLTKKREAQQLKEANKREEKMKREAKEALAKALREQKEDLETAARHERQRLKTRLQTKHEAEVDKLEKEITAKNSQINGLKASKEIKIPYGDWKRSARHVIVRSFNGDLTLSFDLGKGGGHWQAHSYSRGSVQSFNEGGQAYSNKKGGFVRSSNDVYG